MGLSIEESQETRLDFRVYFLLWWQQRRVKSPTATFRVMRRGRESREGKEPSAGQCLVLRAQEESLLEVSSPSSKGPSHLTTCPQGRCTPGGDLKSERTGRSSDPAFKHPHPNSPHPPMPTSLLPHPVCHNRPMCINHRSYWTHTDGTGWVLSVISQNVCFLKVSKNIWSLLMPEQQTLRLFPNHSRNFE